MALTATNSPQGLEKIRETCEREILYLPGQPGVTYTRGDQVQYTRTEAFIDVAAAGETGIGTVQETIVCPAASVGMPGPGAFDPVAKSSEDLSLIPVKMNVAAGVDVLLATFSGHADDTVAAYTAATPSITGTVALGGNDDANGAILYIYSGPGAGQANLVADYVTGTKVFTLVRKFAVAPTTASKFIVLEGEGGGSAFGVGYLGRTELKAAGTINVDDGADDGEYIVYMDYRDTAQYLENLTLPIIKRTHLYG